MKKEKLPDGFPVENGNVEGAKEYVCDNCGKVYTPETDGRVYAFAEPDYNYFFCSEECAEQFAKDNGLETFSDQSGFNDYVFELEKDSEQTDEPRRCENCGTVCNDPENNVYYDLGDKELVFCDDSCAEDFARAKGKILDKEDGVMIDEPEPTLIEPEEPPTCYEKKATECWKSVVKMAQEIS